MRYVKHLASLFPALVAASVALPAVANAQAVCRKLEAQLSALESASPQQRGGQTRQLELAIERQRSDLQRLQAYGRSVGCERRSGFFFSAPDECGSIQQQLRGMQGNLQTLEAQLSRLSGGSSSLSGQRAEILAALEGNQCPGYVREQRVQPQRPASIDQRARGFFGWLFGEDADSQPGSVPGYSLQTIDPNNPDGFQEGKPQYSGGLRTICVRLCDGYYFPISVGVSSERIERDERICQAQCPGTEAELFFHHTLGQDVAEAVSTDGRVYSSLPHAFQYRQSFNSDCSCRGSASTWAQALEAADRELGFKRADIVVTAKKAEELAKPIEAKGTRAKQADAKPAVTTASSQRPEYTLEQGEKREVTLPDGTKRVVRLVGPTFVPVP